MTIRHSDEPGCLSGIFFTWMFPLLWQGWKDPESIKNYRHPLPSQTGATYLSNRIESEWKSQLQLEKPSLFRAIANVFGKKYVLLGLSAFVEECVIRIGQPVLLGLLLQYFRGDFSNQEGWILASGVVFMSIWYAVQHHAFFFEMQHNGMQIRVATSALLYKKALKLPSNGTASHGKLTNIMASDVNRLDLSKHFMNYIWIAPCQLIIATAILWTHFGVVSIIGVTLLILFIPIQAVIGKRFGTIRSRISAETDGRLKSMSEVLTGIHTIKVQGWEPYFANKIIDKRRSETKLLMKLAVLRSVNQSLYYVTCKVVLFVMILVYILLDDENLFSEKVFVAVALLNNVRMTLTLFFPLGISQVAEVAVAIKRIQTFLLEAETSGLGIDTVGSSKKEQPKIELTNGVVKWNPQSDKFILQNISLVLKANDFVGIIGPVGSGKTTLLLVLLKELPILSGDLFVNGKIGYAPQEPFIFNGTVRENILFGKSFDDFRYTSIVQDCCLSTDFDQMENGDQTFVLDGNSLSGGQRARISLARALYSNPGILLLDDVLSAVDVNVGKQMLENAIKKYSRDKIVVFVSNQIHHLNSATHIIQLGKDTNGKPTFNGTYQEFVSSDEKIVDHIRKLSTEQCTPETVTGIAQSTGEVICNKNKNANVQKNAETMLSPEIPISMYWNYMNKGAGWLILVLLVLANIMAQTVFTGSDYWLKQWTSDLTEENSDNQPSAVHARNILDDIDSNRNYQIGFYSILIGLLLLFSFLRTTMFFIICILSSKRLHNAVVSSVLFTRLRFFADNPSGRIMNRLSKDIGTMDDTLPVVLFDTVEVGLQVVGVLVVVSIVNYILVLPAIVVCVSFYFIRKLYIVNAQILKRKEGAERSPILSHLNSSLKGITTIRAFKAEKENVEAFHKILDNHSSTWFLYLASARWLGVTVDWVSLIYITTVVLVVMTTSSTDGDAGLAITSAMSLMGILQWGVKQSSEAASQMVAVERIMEYVDLIPEETASLSTSKTGYDNNSETWLTRGKVEFSNIHLKYHSEGNDVLKGISFVVDGGVKIGIAGRTGAGKSSIIAAILRIEEPSSGSIFIDGYNHSTLLLSSLRKSIATVPQTPFLFEGTVRDNLDPLCLYGDDTICRILQDTQLQSAGFHCESRIHIDGNNLSGGQQQLLCFGRAMLSQSKILILDEATANIDIQTEIIIQELVKKYFRNSTVITVAHRMKTLCESDKVLILGGGNILEYGDLVDLKQNPESHLSNMLETDKRQ